jgi:hypothetical protein
LKHCNRQAAARWRQAVWALVLAERGGVNGRVVDGFVRLVEETINATVREPGQVVPIINAPQPLSQKLISRIGDEVIDAGNL